MGSDNLRHDPAPDTSTSQQPEGAAHLPIVIEADGTIFPVDILHEQLIAGLLHQQRTLCSALGRGGYDSWRDRIARTVQLDAKALPIAAPLVDWLTDRHKAGTPLFVLSDAAGMIALEGPLRGIASPLPADEMLAARFPGGFQLLAHPARSAHAGSISASPPLSVTETYLLPAPGWRQWLQAIRPHHWAKNVMIFVPFLLDRGWSSGESLTRILVGFAISLLVVSATYLFNDLCDVSADRRHWSKHQRPIASGAIPVLHAALASMIGIVGGVALGWLLSAAFAGFLLVYVTLTLLYSLWLKTVPLLDAVVIAVLFTNRLTMGIALTGGRYSEWLLTFAMFFFFDLALAKRHAELLRSQELGNALARRGYVPEDAALTLVIGVGSGIAALVIMIIFLVLDAFQRDTFLHPTALWAVPLLLAIWLGRVWLLAHRGKMPDDPITFALRDRPSLLLGALVAAAFVMAL
ncbi:UbiA family prenyltransferase [Dongia sp.]|uniref:UbiA family prenyltransferase n=1 Tax=Dongia sp. TaxID=1977262 RepID=UPI0035AEBD12